MTVCVNVAASQCLYWAEKGITVCFVMDANCDPFFCPVKALTRRYIHARRHIEGTRGWATFMSAFWENGVRYDISDKDMRENLKWAAEQLDYNGRCGIPVNRINTHSLRMGGANALVLSGYSDTQIQKMGRWRGALFKECIREELHSYSEGISRSMQHKFGFVNIAAGSFVDITDTVVVADYAVAVAAAA